MPIHEFKCEKCEGIFEYLFIKTSDDGPEECEHCGHKNVEQIMSSAGFTISLNAREQLFEKTLPSIRKDTQDMLGGNESKMEKILGTEKATQIVKDRIRGEKALDQIKRTK